MIRRRGFGQTADEGPDQLTPAGVLTLSDPNAVGPNLNPGINLSPSTVAAETAGGIPLSVQVASATGTTGSSGNQMLLIGAGVVVAAIALIALKGGRR